MSARFRPVQTKAHDGFSRFRKTKQKEVCAMPGFAFFPTTKPAEA
ncbi:hypothetical protein B4098_0636 [Heyndrickxia coagulans]|uniref:Uncharacterized protein n=1 Tax=Heyndrickxia coagulans TaxID=1398 RepID=A0A150K141_HEYCO|nr:hypothetical protein BCO26_0574 [Heyndrickxia coagulans 2-6]KYC63293.1 hypothetical protein B4098_0636 [Heyndrickxia coagulans]